jgi:hypothetical protein
MPGDDFRFRKLSEHALDHPLDVSLKVLFLIGIVLIEARAYYTAI